MSDFPYCSWFHFLPVIVNLFASYSELRGRLVSIKTSSIQISWFAEITKPFIP